MKNHTTVERKAEREIVVTRIINGPVRLVFEAWTNADLFRKWWVPRSAPIKLLSCEIDARTGGTYRLVFAHDGGEMAFFGRYLEVTPHSRIVWTNEEAGPDGAVTTVTLEEKDGKTLVTQHELYPSKEALEAAAGSTDGAQETYDQLEELLAAA